MTSQHASEPLYELLTAYADGETSADETALIEQRIRSDASFQRALNLEKRTKIIIQEHIRPVPVPEHLYLRCMMAFETPSVAQPTSLPGSHDSAASMQLPENGKPSRVIPLLFRWAAAAVFLAAALYWLGLPALQSPEIASYAVEDHVYRHFAAAHDFGLVTSSTTEAETYIRQNYGLSITVPELDGARFDGISYTEFVPGHTAPMLLYSVAGLNDPVMIFAFKVDHMDVDVRLIRDEDAVATCTHHDAVHIKDIGGKHVVSWKWEDTWYAGISHHDGNVLASMLPINR